jgi:hypothetical protein
VLPHPEKRFSRKRTNDVGIFEQELPQDVAMREARKASRSHAFDSPMPGEGRKARTARPDEEVQGIATLRPAERNQTRAMRRSIADYPLQ